VARAVPRSGDHEPDGTRRPAAADRHLLLAARARAAPPFCSTPRPAPPSSTPWASCRLPPDWKARGGAAYLGRDRVDGFDCHVWSNFVFARYYEGAATGRPVSWTVVNGAVH